MLYDHDYYDPINYINSSEYATYVFLLVTRIRMTLMAARITTPRATYNPVNRRQVVNTYIIIHNGIIHPVIIRG